MLRRALGAAIVACFLAAATIPGSGFARASIDVWFPSFHATLGSTPAPILDPSDGRIPVSLRLADSIWTDDGSHPPASTEARFELDKSYRLDLSRVPRCPWAPIQRYPAFDWDSCTQATVATGRIKWEISFPERDAVLVGAKGIAYRGMRNELLIRTDIPAPVSGEVVIPVALSPTGEGRYGLKATAAIPKVAGGSGSLTYLGLRFRKGLFSLACPHGRLQSRLTNTFLGGEVASTGLIQTC